MPKFDAVESDVESGKKSKKSLIDLSESDFEKMGLSVSKKVKR